MYTHVLILPDGRELSSGIQQEQALQSVTVTLAVNQGQELTLGSVCAAELQAELIIPYGRRTPCVLPPTTVSAAWTQI